MKIRFSKVKIGQTWRVMSQLRDIKKPQYISRVKHQILNGYNLCGVRESKHGRVVSASGFRFSKSLKHGPHIYVEDLVTDKENRSHGHGKKLMDTIESVGKHRNSKCILLDSGVQRFKTHKFYIKNNFDIKSYLMMRSLTSEQIKSFSEQESKVHIELNSKGDLQSYYSLMQNLHIEYTLQEFKDKVCEQQKEGYKILGIKSQDKLVAAAGIRFRNSLAMGKHVYIEDFVVDGKHYEQEYGDQLIQSITLVAASAGTKIILAESGVQCHQEHKLYYKNLFEIRAFLFKLPIAYGKDEKSNVLPTNYNAFIASSKFPPEDETENQTGLLATI